MCTTQVGALPLDDWCRGFLLLLLLLWQFPGTAAGFLLLLLHLLLGLFRGTAADQRLDPDRQPAKDIWGSGGLDGGRCRSYSLSYVPRTIHENGTVPARTQDRTTGLWADDVHVCRQHQHEDEFSPRRLAGRNGDALFKYRDQVAGVVDGVVGHANRGLVGSCAAEAIRRWQGVGGDLCRCGRELVQGLPHHPCAAQEDGSAQWLRRAIAQSLGDFGEDGRACLYPDGFVGAAGSCCAGQFALESLDGDAMRVVYGCPTHTDRWLLFCWGGCWLGYLVKFMNVEYIGDRGEGTRLANPRVFVLWFLGQPLLA
ncbi:hypothetical protein QBC39DRAFT_351103 [Podospora conica]|nr:hypothetical protein QBC39DRAFT_351103 [Schizothecium conicum]